MLRHVRSLVVLSLCVIAVQTASAAFLAPAVDSTFTAGGNEFKNLGNAASVFTSLTLTVDSQVAPGTLSATNQLAVHVTMYYPAPLQTLQINVTHAGRSVQLFAIRGGGCPGYIGTNDTASQLIFSDQSVIPKAAITCDQVPKAGVPWKATPTFQGGEAYVIPSFADLSAFYGLPASGDYILTIRTVPNDASYVPTAQQVAARRLVSWGLTFNPRTCGPSQYLSGLSLPNAVCAACPANSVYPSMSGLGTINSCPCAGGYTPSRAGTCQACPFGEYRYEHLEAYPYFQQRQGIYDCKKCNGKTNWIAANNASACTDFCDAGFQAPAVANGPGECLPCPKGTYKDFAGTGACIACRPRMSTPAVGAISNTTCGCDIGYESVSVAWDCQQCQHNSFKNFIGAGACTSCGPYATVASTLDKCVCNEGYADYTRNPDASGAGCTPKRSWSAGDWSACSTTCDGGVRVRNVVCVDQTGRTYNSSDCDQSAQPWATEPCNTSPCVAAGYTPQYASGLLNRPIPFNNVIQSTVIVPPQPRSVANTYDATNSSIAVHVAFQWPEFKGTFGASEFQTLKISLTHGGVTVMLFDLGSNSCYGGANAPAQLVFHDNATIPSARCNTADNQDYRLMANESYILQPFQPLLLFKGLPVDGEYTLNVYTTNGTRPDPEAVAPLRRFISWGITVGVRSCAKGEYIPGAFLDGSGYLTGYCIACPANHDTSLTKVGVNGINSCPCIRDNAFSYDARVKGQCTQCNVTGTAGVLSYGATDPRQLKYYQQAQGIPSCVSCNRYAGDAISNVDCDIANNGGCAAGYGQGSSTTVPCVICPIGTWSAGNSSAACTACPTGQTTGAPGATSIAQCGCAPGTNQTAAGAACQACPVGTYANTFRADGTAAAAACLPCTSRALNNAATGQSVCPCDSGYHTYIPYPRPDGSDCVPQLNYTVGAWSQCSTICGTGTQTRQVNCTNAVGQLQPFKNCTAYVPAPPTQQVCNAQSCTSFGYVPQYIANNGEALNAQIPILSGTAASNQNAAPVGSWNNTIIIPAGSGFVGDAGNSLIAVTFSAVYDRPLSGLQISLTHGGVTVPIFTLPLTCNAAFEQFSQLVLVDAAGLPPLQCSGAAQYPAFLSNEAYILAPASSIMAAFNGMPMEGEWTLSVWNSAVQFQGGNRRVVTWGLVRDARICDDNQYVPTPNLSGVCVSCPMNSFPSLPGVNGINSCPCRAGFDSRIAGACTACATGTYRSLSDRFPLSPTGSPTAPIIAVSPSFLQQQNVAGCSPCYSSTNRGIRIRDGASTCNITDCNPGYTTNAGQSVGPCVACAAGQFKPTRGAGACAACPVNTYSTAGSATCIPCSVNATAVAGSATCSCRSGFVDYSSTKPASGAGCIAQRQWSAGAWTVCSSRCEFGLQDRNVRCSDVRNNTYDDSQCAGAGPKPPTRQRCNTMIPCVPNTFVPEYSSGFLNWTIPEVGTIEHVVRVPEADFSFLGMIDGDNQVAIHFSASYWLFIQTLKVQVCHAGICVRLFDLGPTPCLGSFGSEKGAQGAQVVFSDYSSVPGPLYCSNANLITFKANEVYVIPPKQVMAAWYGQNSTGNWTISLTTTANAYPVANAIKQSRYFISWGVTFNPITVQANEYISGWSLVSGIVSSCPLNSQPSTTAAINVPGAIVALNAITSCPCLPGFDASTPYQCTVCPTGTYRAYNPFVPRYFQQQQGVPACAPCHSSTVAGVNGLPTLCGNDCEAGYYYNPAFGCTPCGRGYFKSTQSSEQCTSCASISDGMTTVSRTAKSAAECTCLPGFDSVTEPGVCTPCLPGTFKSTQGAGACSLCDYKAVSGPAATFCSCMTNTTLNQPLTNYNPSILNGSACDVPVQWEYGGWSDCTGASCDVGVQTRDVRCVDFAGRVWPNSKCEGQWGSADVNSQACRLLSKPCVQYGYVPDSPSGYLNQSVPGDSTVYSTNTFTVSSDYGFANISSAQFTLIVNLAGQVGVGDVEFTLTHNDNGGAGDQTFTLTGTSCKPAGLKSNSITNDGIPVSAATQLIFSPAAPSNYPTWNSGCGARDLYAGNVNTFYQSAWGSLDGLKLTGTYKLGLKVTNAATIVSWGFSVNPTTCSGSSYVSSPEIRGTCTACPNVESTPDASSKFVAHDVCFGTKFCAAGSSFASPSLCTPCPANTKTSNSVQFNVPTCVACNGVTVAGAATCSDYCFAGYQPNTVAGEPCAPCPFNTYKSWAGPNPFGNNTCSACTANSVTASTGSRNATDCRCLAGYKAVSVSDIPFLHIAEGNSIQSMTYPRAAGTGINGSMTLEAWVRLASDYQSAAPNTERVIISQPDSNTPMYLSIKHVSTTSEWKLHGSFYNPTSGATSVNTQIEAVIDDTNQDLAGRWFHVAFTVMGQANPYTLKLYLDGLPVGQVDLESPTREPFGVAVANTAIYIGSYDGVGTRAFTGDIDSIRLWRTALTDRQIYDNFYTPGAFKVNPYPSTLVASWEFTSYNWLNPAAKIVDAVGTFPDATLAGTYTWGVKDGCKRVTDATTGITTGGYNCAGARFEQFHKECVACDVNTFKASIGDDTSCTACAANADTAVLPASSACSCSSGYVRYPTTVTSATNPDGSACQFERKWTMSEWSACSSTCDLGYQQRSVGCADVSQGTFVPIADSFCLVTGAKPATNRTCVAPTPCVPTGFYPTYSSSRVDLLVPNTNLSLPIGDRVNQIKHTITVPPNSNRIVSATNNTVAITINFLSASSIETLRFDVEHMGVKVTIFSLNPDTGCAAGRWGGAAMGSAFFPSQVTFTDAASLAYPTCDSSRNLPNFWGNSSYVVQPYNWLRAFDGLPESGDWILTVTSLPTLNWRTAMDTRILVSWGVSFNPVRCAVGSYAAAARFIGAINPFVDTTVSAPTATCTACASGSTLQYFRADAVNSYATCPCAAGFTNVASEFALCQPCVPGTYKNWTNVYHQAVGVPYSCDACNSNPIASTAGSTRAAQTCNFDTCNAGFYYMNDDAGCVQCPVNMYCAGGARTVVPVACPTNSFYTPTVGAAGATQASDCKCRLGTTRTGTAPALSCVECGVNTTTTAVDSTVCTPCSNSATTLRGVGATNCTCAAGFILDPTFAVNGTAGVAPNNAGSHCVPTPSWDIGTFGACSQGCDGGVQTRTVQCKAGSTVYTGDAAIIGCGPQPATTQPCNTHISCVNEGYVAEFNGNLRNQSIPVGATSALVDTVIVPASRVGVVRADSQIAVVFNAQYTTVANLRVELEHAGVIVTLFSGASSCSGAVGSATRPAQLVFADNATVAFTCNAPFADVSFNADESYIIKPVAWLSSFYGTPLSGEWKVRIYSSANVPASTRRLVSWGITFGIQSCLPGQYIPTMRQAAVSTGMVNNAPVLNYGGCILCPSNTFPVAAGVNGINSCPCLSGYDASNKYTCTACPVRTFRAVTAVIAAFTQKQGVAACDACNGATAGTGSVSGSACLQDSCDAGYTRNPSNSGPCVPCAVGSFKNVSNSGAACTSCSSYRQFSTTVATGANSSALCQCAPGYQYNVATGACTQCSANQFKWQIDDSVMCASCDGTSETSAAGSAVCTCKPGYFDTDYKDSVPCRQWTETVAGTCQAGSPYLATEYSAFTNYGTTCSTGRFLQGATMTCSAGAGKCDDIPYFQHRPCFGSFGSNGCAVSSNTPFSAQYGTGNNANSPIYDMTNDAGSKSIAIAIPKDDLRVINATSNALAVHVDLRLKMYLQSVKLNLVSPSGKRVRLFDTGAAVCYGFMLNVQVIFSDDAPLPPLTCNNDQLITLKNVDAATATYAVRPVEPLAAFANQTMAGVWQLEVVHSALGYPNTVNQFTSETVERFIFGAGITTNPTKCPPNTYLDASKGLSATDDNTPVCVPCPTGSNGHTGGVATITTCGLCGAGRFYDKVSSSCIGCPMGTFRWVNPLAPAWQQISTTCNACHSSTRTVNATSASECMTDCEVGYEPIFPSNTHVVPLNLGDKTQCRPCGAGAFKSVVGAVACTTCEQFRANTTAKSTVQPDLPYTTSDNCHCKAGFQNATVANATACVQCPPGTYKSVVNDAVSCQACPANSNTTSYGSVICPCNANYTRGGADAATACTPLTTWKVFGDWTQCTKPCSGGMQSRNVSCTDLPTGTMIYDNSNCDASLKPQTSRACNVNECITWGYIPHVQSGYLNVSIPHRNRGAWRQTINVFDTTGRVISAVNRPAIHFSAAYWGSLQSLRVDITHNGVTVPLFAFDPSISCANSSFEGTGAQVVFVDQATIPTLVCSEKNKIVFRQGESYVIQPAAGASLSALDGLPVAGPYTISVWSEDTADYVPFNAVRRVVGWGVSFRPTVCPTNTFVKPPMINSTICTPCPSNSFPVNSGVNGINSCPCMAGYDASTEYTCTKCTSNSVRRIAPDVQVYYQLKQGAVSCRSCFGSSATDATRCDGITCNPGYYSLQNGDPCIPVPPGTYKDGTGVTPKRCSDLGPSYYTSVFGTSAAVCSSCVGNSVANPSATGCVCAAGYADYSANPAIDGSTCTGERKWVISNPSTCSSTCESGFITRDVVCADTTTIPPTIYDASVCAARSPRPPIRIPCNTGLCTKYGYIPQFPSSGVFLPIPVPTNQLRAGYGLASPTTVNNVASMSHSIVVPPPSPENRFQPVIASDNQVVVHFSFQYDGFLDTLEVDVSHNGVTARLIQFTSGAACQFSGTVGNGSQIIFSDDSSHEIRQFDCSRGSFVRLQQGHVYVVPPVNALSAFWGQQVNGTWTITVKSKLGSIPVPQENLNSRRLISWGVSIRPTICAADQFVVGPFVNTGRCQACPLNTALWNGMGVNSPCPCLHGFESTSGAIGTRCTACSAGFYKSVRSFDTCQRCSPTSFSTLNEASTNCTCLPGTNDYSPFGAMTAGGQGCALTRTWVPSAYGACSADCDGGIQTRTVTCQSADGQIYDDRDCASQPKPPTQQTCQTRICVIYGYAPQFNSNNLDRPIRLNATNAIVHTISVPKPTGAAPTTISATNQLAVSVSFVYQNYLHTLRVRIDHAGKSVELMNLGQQICKFGGTGGDSSGAQLTFSDQSSEPTLYCDNENLVTFRDTQAYIVLPTQPLAGFYGSPVEGDYTISVYSTMNDYQEPIDLVSSRRLRSWGITFNPTVCGKNQYVKGTADRLNPARLNSGVCDACPANSHPNKQGVNAISSCSCMAGYDALNAYSCRPCPIGWYRSVSVLSLPSFQIQQGTRQCTACLSSTNSIASTSVSDCSTDCDAGSFYQAGIGCTKCPLGTYKETKSSVADQCVKCPFPGQSTGEPGASAASQCYCAPGYTFTTNANGPCVACGPGLFKAGTDNDSPCRTCAPGSSPVNGATSCACDAGYTTEYGNPNAEIPVDGSACRGVYRWVTGTWSTCSATCGQGAITRSVFCSQNGTGPVDDSFCNAATKPVSSQVCNTAPCSANLYTPQISAREQQSFPVDLPVNTVIESVLRITPDRSSARLDNNNRIAVFVDLNIPDSVTAVEPLSNLKITLTYSSNGVDVTVPLFKLSTFDSLTSTIATRCPGKVLGSGTTQWIFSDSASLSTPTCDENNVLAFHAGQAYAFQPFQPLAGFNNLFVYGTWTLRVHVHSQAGVVTGRQLVNWGITVNPVSCGNSEYFVGTSFSSTGGACRSCPATTGFAQSIAGVNTINSCGCYPGFDHRNFGSCTACTGNTYKNSWTLGACLDCGANAAANTTATGTWSGLGSPAQTYTRTRCDCNANFVDYSPFKPASGSQCTKRREWYTGLFGSCNAPCASGRQYRDVYCSDSNFPNQRYPDSDCTGTKPVTSQACNQVPCAKYGSQAVFAKYFNATQPIGMTTTNTFTITADEVAALGLTNSWDTFAQSELPAFDLVLFAPNQFHQFTIQVAFTPTVGSATTMTLHSASSSWDASCEMAALSRGLDAASISAGTSGAQLIFSPDGSRYAPGLCGPKGSGLLGNLIAQAGHSYSFTPVDVLSSALSGRSISGTYSLSINVPSTVTSVVGAPQLISFGITPHGARCLEANTYLPSGLSLNGTACVKCPVSSNFTSSALKLNTLSDCACADGFYLTSTAVTGSSVLYNHVCTACERGTYRQSDLLLTAGAFQQKADSNSALCVNCYAGSFGTAATATAFRSGCSNTCNAGFQYNGAVCEVCPQNSYKELSNAGACTTCVGGTGTDNVYTATNPPTRPEVCVCTPGKFLFNSSYCATCPAGTYKSTYESTTSCTACAKYAESASDFKSCSCLTGWTAVGTSVSGANCWPIDTNAHLQYLNVSIGRFVRTTTLNGSFDSVGYSGEYTVFIPWNVTSITFSFTPFYTVAGGLSATYTPSQFTDNSVKTVSGWSFTLDSIPTATTPSNPPSVTIATTAASGGATRSYKINIQRALNTHALLTVAQFVSNNTDAELFQPFISPQFESKQGNTEYTVVVPYYLTDIQFTPRWDLTQQISLVQYNKTGAPALQALAVDTPVSITSLPLGVTVLNALVTAQNTAVQTMYTFNIVRVNVTTPVIIKMVMIGSIETLGDRSAWELAFNASMANVTRISATRIAVRDITYERKAGQYAVWFQVLPELSNPYNRAPGLVAADLQKQIDDMSAGVATPLLFNNTFFKQLVVYPQIIQVSLPVDAALAGLTVGPVTPSIYSPAFNPEQTFYRIFVPNGVTNIKLTPYTADQLARVAIRRGQTGAWTALAYAPGVAPVWDDTTPLVVGVEQAFQVRVTAGDGWTTRIYTLLVTRYSNTAKLNSLTIDGSGVNGFTPDTNAYNVRIATTSGTISIVPTLTVLSIGASISAGIAGAPLSGVANGGAIAFSIPVGVTVINIAVTAQDGVQTNTYVLTITRPSSNANLATLQASDPVSTNPFGLAPLFFPTGYYTGTAAPVNVIQYSAVVSATQTLITLSLSTADSGAKVELEIVNYSGGGIIASSIVLSAANATSTQYTRQVSLTVQNTQLNIKVTAADLTTFQTYRLVIAKLSNNADLSGLTTSTNAGPNTGTGFVLTPAFASNVLAYNREAAGAATSIDVTPTKSDAGASVFWGANTVAVQPSLMTRFTTTATIGLPGVGTTFIFIQVLASDGIATKTYTITVLQKDGNNQISSIGFSTGSLSPSFSATTMTGYVLTLGSSITSLAVTPTLGSAVATARYSYSGPAGSLASTAVTCAGASCTAFNVPMGLGVTTVQIVVTAQDSTTNTYSFTVTRYSYDWSSSAWSTCVDGSNVAVPCGGGAGTQTRTVTCRNQQTGALEADGTCTTSKPATSQACTSGPCSAYAWASVAFGSCDCCTQLRSYSVYCYLQSDANRESQPVAFCAGLTKPPTVYQCTTTELSTCRYRWSMDTTQQSPVCPSTYSSCSSGTTATLSNVNCIESGINQATDQSNCLNINGPGACPKPTFKQCC